MAEGNPTTMDPLNVFLLHWLRVKLLGYFSAQNWSFSVWNHQMLGDHQNLRLGPPAMIVSPASDVSLQLVWKEIYLKHAYYRCMQRWSPKLCEIPIDSISWDFLVQFLRVSRFLSLCWTSSRKKLRIYQPLGRPQSAPAIIAPSRHRPTSFKGQCCTCPFRKVRPDSIWLIKAVISWFYIILYC